MTVQKDVQRAGLRAMMAESMIGVPDYSADTKAVDRVGSVIGVTAGHEERHVRASDGLLRSTSKVATPEQPHKASSNLLWPVTMVTSFCTVGLLAMLAYWQFG